MENLTGEQFEAEWREDDEEVGGRPEVTERGRGSDRGGYWNGRMGWYVESRRHLGSMDSGSGSRNFVSDLDKHG